MHLSRPGSEYTFDCQDVSFEITFRGRIVSRPPLRDAEKNIAVARKALASAEESYRISKLRYETGAGTNTEVLDAQTALVQAEGNQYQALYDYDIAVAKLQYAMGAR